jgi:hypothetical protein
MLKEKQRNWFAALTTDYDFIVYKNLTVEETIVEVPCIDEATAESKFSQLIVLGGLLL